MALRAAISAMDWKKNVTTPEKAIELVPAGASVAISGGCAVPESLVAALNESASDHPGTRLVHEITRLIEGPFTGDVRHRAMAIGPDTVELAKRGRAQYLPILSNEAPRAMFEGRLDVDVMLVQVSRPDAAGMCSLGVTVGLSPAAIERAAIVIAEINDQMPRAKGQAQVPFTAFDAVVRVDRPVATYTPSRVPAEPERIARYVARLVADGSTLHIGQGLIPSEVLRFLTTRRDLGVHTDIVTDAVIDLVDEGVITGRKKTMAKGRIVASQAMGTQKLYDRLGDDNLFSMRPVEQVADARVVAEQFRMVSISQAFSCDLTGQVCAEARDGHLYGGVGTLPVFHYGAARSPGGRAIVCLPSVDSHGRSSIRAVLDPGEGVTVPRYETRWIVTEHGEAYLHGRTLSERAVALIEIAHPDHRVALLSEAKRLGLVPQDQQMRSRRDYPVEEERTVTLRDGTEVLIRPTVTGDAKRLQELFYELDPRDVYTRFFRNLSSLTRQAAEHLCSVGYESEMAFAAVIGDEETGQRAIATSSYFVDADTNLADVAYMVSPKFQGQGLGTRLHEVTVDYAMRTGVRGFTADILEDNPAMLSVFAKGPGHLSSHVSLGVYEIELLFSEPPPAAYSTSSIPRVDV
jgi:acyl-CoA hydrolase/GNAT superfamily N-acetyltransferase